MISGGFSKLIVMQRSCIQKQEATLFVEEIISLSQTVAMYITEAQSSLYGTEPL